MTSVAALWCSSVVALAADPVAQVQSQAGAQSQAVAQPQAGAKAQPQQWVSEHLESMLEVYRYLHQNPELSTHEEQTGIYVGKQFAALGAEVTNNVGGHGVVGVIRNGEGPVLMLRCDLDGLPVTEKTELVYASTARAKNSVGDDVGVMHACGHDMHMSCVIGTARYLAAHRDQWRGTLLLIGQPAEETGVGAKAMLEDGLFTRFPKPDYAVALHVDAELEAGKVSTRPGYLLANVDTIDITMHGRGGHGAWPHTTIDPVVLAAHLVLDLQTIISREVGPFDPAVITVGSIHGGTKHNIIGNSCDLQVTVRSLNNQTRDHLVEAIERKAKAVAAGARAPEPTIKVLQSTPALFNDEKLADHLRTVFIKALGEQHVAEAPQVMGGEDFARYGVAGVPIFMFGLGTVDPQRMAKYRQLQQPPPSLHSPLFYPDAEDSLAIGVTAMTTAALDILGKP